MAHGGRRALSPAREAEVIAAFMAGETQPALAERFGVGLNTIARTLKRAGVGAAMREPASGKADPAALDAFAAFGPAPVNSSLEVTGWLHRVLATAVGRAALDPELTEKQRRREIAQLGRAAVAAFPLAIVEQAHRLIEEEGRWTKRFDAEPKLVPVAELDAADRAAGREAHEVGQRPRAGRPPDKEHRPMTRALAKAGQALATENIDDRSGE